MGDNEDISTIVLDFNDMKSRLDETEDIIEGDASVDDLAFSLDPQLSTKNVEATQKKIFLIAYKTNYFYSKTEIFNSLKNCQVIVDIKELNQVITKNADAIFVMFFNDTPKAINQISEQIKSKFPKASSLIIATNLSTSKAKKHQSSKYGANAYLNEPFTLDELNSTLTQLDLLLNSILEGQ